MPAKAGSERRATKRTLAARLALAYLVQAMHSVPKLEEGEGSIRLTVSQAGRIGGLRRAKNLRESNPDRLREIAAMGGRASKGKRKRRRRKPQN